MMQEKGNLSIDSENIFPIIKKWLYSDQDIYVRELISNGVDAIQKLRKLKTLGEADIPDDEEFRVDVTLDPENKTVTFSDNGIGMTADEVKKYITQIAFSGAAEFLEKYKDAGDDSIIGHFGLGFYSAFMVSSLVEIETLSYLPDAQPVHWSCDGGSAYEMSEGSRTARGTDVILHMNEDGEKYLSTWEMRTVIEKYCAFMPVPIFLTNLEDEKKKAEEAAKAKEEAKKSKKAKKAKDSTETKEPKTLSESTDSNKVSTSSESKEASEVSDSSEPKEASEVSDSEESSEDAAGPEQPKPVNDTSPLWLKNPSDCTDEEYREFYRKVFMDYREPLFWIHLNMDYPFNLKGILYFPKLGNEFESAEGQVKLYCNQVFVADNVKEIIPDFLLLLKGVIDCPDIPLNVSRSFLQNDSQVRKISEYITRKVADKLKSLYNTDRANYEKYWEDIHPFIKYGCLRNEKFLERVQDSVIYKSAISGNYITLPEYLEAAKEKHENKVFYTTDARQQAQYLKVLEGQGYDALVLGAPIDAPFITQLEQKNEGVKFFRVDADLNQTLKEENSKTDEKAQKKLEKLFTKALGKEKLKVRLESLKDESVSAMIELSEESRRMQDMMRMYGGMGMQSPLSDEDETLVLNQKNALIAHLIENPEGEDSTLLALQIYDLARLSHRPLEANELNAFISRSQDLMNRFLTK